MLSNKPFVHKYPRKGKKPSEPFAVYEPEEPQESLVSIGGNFFATPDTPADPMDCDRYPDSPWCGGNPIDLENPVSLDIDIVQDECNFGVQFSGTLGFIKLPPLQVVYRNPNCIPPPPLPLGDFPAFLPPKIPENACNAKGGGIPQIVVFQSDSFFYRQGFNDFFTKEYVLWEEYSKKIRIKQVEFFPSGEYAYHIKFEININWEYNEDYAIDRNLPFPSPYQINQVVTFGIKRYVSGFVQPIDGSQAIYIDPFDLGGVLTYSTIYYDYFATGKGTYSADWFSRNGDFFRNYEDNESQYEGYITIEKVGSQFHVFCGDYKVLPPPPAKPKKKCCMSCDNNDALLKLILKRIGNLPASVPDYFTKQNPSYISIESLAELMLWQMQQLDALMGSYPIKIEVEDTDLTKEGNQTQKLELPNQAELLAELLGLVITLKRDTHATLVTAIKAMGESGMTKNLATQTLDVTLANAEFLGYKLEQVKRKIPSLFTPGGANLEETLKEKEVEIVSYENTDKKDLQDDLKFLKTMAARWNAQNWRQVTGEPVESLKQSLFGNPDAIKDTHKENEQGDFNDFTEQAERGFIEISGITDTVNPWGRPYKERPKIREIGTEKGNYTNDGKERIE
ncbi:hypothetical protein NIES4072_18600 [Nostoc commune NIES-4072]|uniref:Uncharacterized protein n=1 Tax=Nostoc commune NIES-4072 TaxID=2005467 RepID=A0A2R5FHP9_NOSCO|nr:hypothetical protein [Nostoc commune]BBD64478.1 hypothetical protein NIES4070_08210 [Nostoc commune HK-02]GBG18196.1 hypothetical protein NIES4072_18600 [Nostoc commune NIES-4072]